jgi:hypothetical protein
MLLNQNLPTSFELPLLGGAPALGRTTASICTLRT